MIETDPYRKFYEAAKELNAWLKAEQRYLGPKFLAKWDELNDKFESAQEHEAAEKLLKVVGFE